MEEWEEELEEATKGFGETYDFSDIGIQGFTGKIGTQKVRRHDGSSKNWIIGEDRVG